MTEKDLLARVSRMAQCDDLPDFTPSRVGVLVFETLVREWDVLAPESREDLLVALGILVRESSSEARAERATQEILVRLGRGGR